MADGDPQVDELTYQDKGVFYSNVMEIVRVIKVAATRIIGIETKLKDVTGGTAVDPALQALPKTVNDLVDVVQALKAEADSTNSKLNKLFPDENIPPANVPDPPAKVPDTQSGGDAPAGGNSSTGGDASQDKPAEDKPAGDTSAS